MHKLYYFSKSPKIKKVHAMPWPKIGKSTTEYKLANLLSSINWRICKFLFFFSTAKNKFIRHLAAARPAKVTRRVYEN